MSPGATTSRRPSGPGLAERLRERYADLSPSERRAADVALEHADLALDSASELAARSGVSKATVSRLYRRLGYAGADEVREEARGRRAAGAPVAVGTSPLATRIAAEQAAIARCLMDAEPVLPAVAALLAGARSVLVVGFRSGRPIAEGLRHGLAQVRPGVALAPGAGHTLAEELAGAAREDVVVLVGPRRRPAGFGRLVAVLTTLPPRVVLLGDATSRRWAGDVDHWLACPLDTGGAFDSHAPAVALVSVLADAVLAATGEAGPRRVEEVADLYRRLGELEGP